MKKKIIILILIFLSLVNLGLSISIEIQKSSSERSFLQNDCKLCDPELGNDCSMQSCVEGCTCDGDFLSGNCFAESSDISGCYDVQTSKYANTFGISNPVYGIISFGLISILLISLLIVIKNKNRVFSRKNLENIRMVIFFLIFGGLLVSLWFLYLQFFVIHAICNYCMIVDVIMIIMALLYVKLVF